MVQVPNLQGVKKKIAVNKYLPSFLTTSDQNQAKFLYVI